MFSALALIVAIHAVPEVAVSWADSKAKELDISFTNPQLNVLECLEGGFEYQIEYAVQFCKRREAWFSRCRDERIFKRFLRFDPITEQYNLSTDVKNAEIESMRESFVQSDQAVAALTQIKKLSLKNLGVPESLEGNTTAKQFISVKARWQCSGEKRPVMDAISSLLTFGLVRLSGSTSGNNYFSLARGNKSPPQ